MKDAPIYKSPKATLYRNAFCFSLTIGRHGPYYYGTTHGVRRGLEKRKKLIDIRTMADLEERIGRYEKEEQRRQARLAFGR